MADQDFEKEVSAVLYNEIYYLRSDLNLVLKLMRRADKDLRNYTSGGKML